MVLGMISRFYLFMAAILVPESGNWWHLVEDCKGYHPTHQCSNLKGVYLKVPKFSRPVKNYCMKTVTRAQAQTK